MNGPMESRPINLESGPINFTHQQLDFTNKEEVAEKDGVSNSKMLGIIENSLVIDHHNDHTISLHESHETAELKEKIEKLGERAFPKDFKMPTIQFEGTIKKIIQLAVMIFSAIDTLYSALKTLKKEIINIANASVLIIANASVLLFKKAKNINKKYAIVLGDPTKKMTQLDKSSTGTVFLNSKKSTVIKKFHTPENAKEASKECQFATNIHAKVKKQDLSSVGMPPKVELILGHYGEIKGMKQTAYSEAGLHKYMENTLERIGNKNQYKSKLIKCDIASQALQGFSTLGKLRFCHLDLKPANLLVDVNKDNGAITVGIGDLGSGVDFSSPNIGKIIKQLKQATFSASHLSKKDMVNFDRLQKELENMYAKDPKDPALKGKLDEMEAFANNMSKYAMGMTLAQLFYTKLEISYELKDIGNGNLERVEIKDWLSIPTEKTVANDKTIAEFLEEDSKRAEVDQKCPPAIRDLIAKMADPDLAKRSEVTSEMIEAALATLPNTLTAVSEAASRTEIFNQAYFFEYDTDIRVKSQFVNIDSVEKKPLINLSVPDDETVKSFAQNLLNDLKDYAEIGADSNEKKFFRGIEIKSGDLVQLHQQAFRAKHEPVIYQEQLEFIIAKAQADKNEIFIGDSMIKAIQNMKTDGEIELVASYFADLIKTKTQNIDNNKLKNLLEHSVVVNNPKLRDAILEKALDVQIFEARAAQAKFINSLIPQEYRKDLRKLFDEIISDPKQRDHLNGLEGLKKLAELRNVRFPDAGDIEKIINELKGIHKNLHEGNVELMEFKLSIINEIQELKNKFTAGN